MKDCRPPICCRKFHEGHQSIIDFFEKDVINFNGLQENMVKISKDDKAFLKTTEESTTKSGDHYVLSLLFKKENLIIPNSKKRAMQRIMYLKGRFSKNPEFFEDYKQFMSNVIVKRYARRMDDTSVGRAWYVPHHGVYHQVNQRKSE